MRRLSFCLAFFFAATAFAQRDFSKVEVKATRVSGSVYILEGAGGNIGVSVGNDGVVMIDDQYAPLAPKIEAALRSITDKNVEFLINTHYHGDHTGGNEHFGKSAPIVAHENVRRRLKDGSARFGNTIPPAPEGALPVLTFADAVTIHLNGEDIRAIHAPHAHTDGDVIVWFTGSNVVHMGDNFFNGMFPVIDAENGGSVHGMIRAGEQVLKTIRDDAKIIPGHGPLATPKELRAFVAMLKGTAAAVQRGIDQKKTAAQLKEAKILAEWDKWGAGHMKTDPYIDVLYNDLAGTYRKKR